MLFSFKQYYLVGKNEVCDPIRVKAIYVTKNYKKIMQKNHLHEIFK